MDGVRLRVADRNLQHVVGKLGRRAGGRHLGEVLPRFRFDSAEHVGGAAPLLFAIAPLVPASWPREDEPLGGAPPVSHPPQPPVPVHSEAFRTRPRCLPSARCTPHPVPPRTTFFSRHGFRSWLSSKTRIVSRPTRGTSLRFTTSSVSRRTVQRERPSGGGPHASAMMRCRWCASSKAAFPVVAARTRPGPGRLGDRVGWSAIPSSGSTLRSSPPAGWAAHRPTAAGPKRVAPSARAVNHSATSAATPAVPAWTTEPQIAPSCPSYKLGHDL